jgi:hypothetical protein
MIQAGRCDVIPVNVYEKIEAVQGDGPVVIGEGGAIAGRAPWCDTARGGSSSGTVRVGEMI